MRGYFRRAALAVAEATGGGKISVSDMYDDDSGLSEMNTFTMPVFYQPYEKCPPIHYGVIGADMRQSDYRANGIVADSLNFENDVSNWNEHVTECKSIRVTRCHMQVMREKEGQCVYPLEKSGDEKCFEFKKHIYYIEDKRAMKLEEAKEYCLSLSGQMIAPRDVEERRFLATLMPPDGAWINITHDDEIDWKWPDGERLDPEERKSIERSCDYPLPPGFYMDPRDYDNNFQCVQQLERKTAVCRFDARQRPKVCRSNVVLCTLVGMAMTVCFAPESGVRYRR